MSVKYFHPLPQHVKGRIHTRIYSRFHYLFKRLHASHLTKQYRNMARSL